MRVALLSYNGQARDAIGNGLAENLRFFLERGADVRVFVQSAVRLHPVLAPYCQVAEQVQQAGSIWDFLAGADLVSFEFSQAYELLHYLPLLAGRKPRLVVDYHGVTPARHWPTPQRAALESGAAQQGLVWCADHVVVHSRFMRRELVRATRFPDERIHQLDFPLPAAFHPGPARWSLRAQLGLGDARLLLFVGRLAPNKNVPVLVEALARLRDSAPEVHAIVVGDTSDIYAGELRRCRDLARQLGVDNRVHFLGSVTEERLADCYRDADLLVIPSAHEGFCIPIAEAQACGLPVIAARATALPETVGGAGLTFALGDIQDLANQVRRVLWDGSPEPSVQPDGSGEPSHDAIIASPTRKIAIVCFRFGDDIVGGAETSLRKIALALQRCGESVEVFTTCNRAESAWANELPATTIRQEGLVVHRFPIDPHVRERHLQSVRSVIESEGNVSAEAERDYLTHSIHSAALVAKLRERTDEFKAIITGPYLFGLTCDVAETFPRQTLVLPCFHDEPLAHLKTWPLVYGRVAGVLFHSPEERELAQSELGINHPNSVEIGTFLTNTAAPTRKADPFSGKRYLVYCGRYSEQKCLPRLVEYMARYQSEHPERFGIVFMGMGEVRLPAQAWARDLGRVDEDTKRAVLAGAAALVQLSRQESLSLVVLEAWAQGTPVLVDERCSVLAGQLRRCQGGAACADYESFAQALDDLWDNPAAWQERGRRGQAYVRQRYSSQADFSTAILTAVEAIGKPLAEQMRRRGLARAALSARPSWQARLARSSSACFMARPGPITPMPALLPCAQARSSNRPAVLSFPFACIIAAPTPSAQTARRAKLFSVPLVIALRRVRRLWPGC